MTEITRYQLNVPADGDTFNRYESLTYYMYQSSPLLHTVWHEGYAYSFKYEDVKLGEWRDVLVREHFPSGETIEWAFTQPVEWQAWEPKTSKMTVEQFISEFESFVKEFGGQHE